MKVKPFSTLSAIESSIYKITQNPEIPKLSIWQPHKIGNIDNPEVAVGDTVLYKEFSGTELEFEGKNLLLVPYSDILGKVVETHAL